DPMVGARAVDQCIDATPLLPDLFDQSLGGFDVGHVALYGQPCAAVCVDSVDDLSGFGNASAIAYRHRPTTRGEIQSDGAADAFGTPGDERNPLIQFGHSGLSLPSSENCL